MPCPTQSGNWDTSTKPTKNTTRHDPTEPHLLKLISESSVKINTFISNHSFQFFNDILVNIRTMKQPKAKVLTTKFIYRINTKFEKNFQKKICSLVLGYRVCGSGTMGWMSHYFWLLVMFYKPPFQITPGPGHLKRRVSKKASQAE